MDYDLIRAALFIVGGVLFYAVLARGLFRITEPYRWAALDIAERLIHSAQVSPYRKEGIQRRLSEVYSGRQSWKMVFLLLLVLFDIVFKRSDLDEEASSGGVPSHLRNDNAKFKIYWMVSTVANSPAAAFIFTLLLIITLAFAASIAAISRSLDLAHDHHGGNHGTSAA
jgi:hypothetical protein